MIDRPLKELASNHVDVYKLDQLNLTEEKYQVVKDIIANKGSLVDTYIDQYWCLDGKDVLYHGKIFSYKNPTRFHTG